MGAVGRNRTTSRKPFSACAARTSSISRVCCQRWRRLASRVVSAAAMRQAIGTDGSPSAAGESRASRVSVSCACTSLSAVISARIWLARTRRVVAGDASAAASGGIAQDRRCRFEPQDLARGDAGAGGKGAAVAPRQRLRTGIAMGQSRCAEQRLVPGVDGGGVGRCTGDQRRRRRRPLLVQHEADARRRQGKDGRALRQAGEELARARIARPVEDDRIKPRRARQPSGRAEPREVERTRRLGRRDRRVHASASAEISRA